MTSRQYDAIDERVAAEIMRLHEKHPRLGHHGLLEALRHAQVRIDPNDLEFFLKERYIKPDRPWRPWRLAGLPRWMGGSTDYRGTRTGWRFWRR